MTFHSFDFLLFCLVTATGYFLLPQVRRSILLCASLFFYAYFSVFLALLLLFTAWLNQRCMLAMQKKDEGRKRQLLYAAVLWDLGILFYYKYLTFFFQVGQDVFPQLHVPHLEILLPAGISFYTFQMIGALVDRYRSSASPVPGFLDFTLFCFYFPQIMAGPIERLDRLLPQLQRPGISRTRIQSGLWLCLGGLIKKVVIADSLASSVDPLLGEKNLLSTLVAASAFALQIYADFSGYTDLARGLSRIAGIRLSRNFRFPFFASTPTDFWRRWHITLGAFLRDYVYIPLGGNRHGLWLSLRNLLVVWILTGLWHGASYGFLLWGLHCFFFLAISRLWLDGFFERRKWCGYLFTFFTFSLGLLHFRPEEILFTPAVPGGAFFSALLPVVLFSSMLLLLDLWQYLRPRQLTMALQSPLTGGFLLGMGWILIALFTQDEKDDFFYFQF